MLLSRKIFTSYTSKCFAVLVIVILVLNLWAFLFWPVLSLYLLTLECALIAYRIVHNEFSFHKTKTIYWTLSISVTFYVILLYYTYENQAWQFVYEIHAFKNRYGRAPSSIDETLMLKLHSYGPLGSRIEYKGEEDLGFGPMIQYTDLFGRRYYYDDKPGAFREVVP